MRATDIRVHTTEWNWQTTRDQKRVKTLQRSEDWLERGLEGNDKRLLLLAPNTKEASREITKEEIDDAVPQMDGSWAIILDLPIDVQKMMTLIWDVL